MPVVYLLCYHNFVDYTYRVEHLNMDIPLNQDTLTPYCGHPGHEE